MPFNGSGTFTLTYTWATEAGSPPIAISKLDTQEADLATGLSNCITKDGQTTITAAIPFNDKRLTGLGNATADADALNRVTADGRYGRYITKRKNSTTARQSTNTLSNDPDLIAALETSSFYGFECFVKCTPGNGGIALCMEYSGTSTAAQTFFAGHGMLNSANAIYGFRGFGSSNSCNAATGGVSDWFRIWGTIATTSTGNLSLQWAQNTVFAADTSVIQGSYLTIIKL